MEVWGVGTEPRGGNIINGDRLTCFCKIVYACCSRCVLCSSYWILFSLDAHGKRLFYPSARVTNNQHCNNEHSQVAGLFTYKWIFSTQNRETAESGFAERSTTRSMPTKSMSNFYSAMGCTEPPLAAVGVNACQRSLKRTSNGLPP